MRFYVAYGSNLNVGQMFYRCPQAEVVSTGVLKDYRLMFRGSQSGNYLTIEPCKGRSVPVVIWQVSKRDEKRLDVYEGYPNFYRKDTIKLDIDDEIVDAFVYVMTGHRPAGIPRNEYYGTCLEGYRQFNFDEEILNQAYRESEREALTPDPEPIDDFSLAPYGWADDRIVRES